ncbi:MAG: type I restriction enzyme HsdR N-terminal domain-containing protein [Porphyromonadaceae bacterium]|nr:type I restriction enzyme HsdR N-terminal domain-containing protein [Porphyromonadaceae bacterium]
MRKANYPRLNLPACEICPIPLRDILGTNYCEEEGNSSIQRKLLNSHPPKTNSPTSYKLKITFLNEAPLVYDDLRQLWLSLTPEEWVRQHFTAHLIRDLGYPIQLMMNEVSLKLDTVDKRIDSVVYNRKQEGRNHGRMAMILEYKAPHIPLSPKVLEQALRYNYATHARYIVISNGLEHQVYHIDYETMAYEVLRYIPLYETIKNI